MAKKVLVTGGAGFIGGHLVEGLVAAGHSVAVLDDLSTGNLANLESVKDSVRFFEGSILDEALVNEATAGVECIFHLAAIASVPQSIAEPVMTHHVNATSMMILLEAAKANGARVVMSSSSAVYGDGPQPIKHEGLPTGPISPYGAQKLICENYLKSYSVLHGLAGISLRYFNVFGTRQNPFSEYAAVIAKFMDRARAGTDLTIFGDGSQTRDFIHVSDVVRANLLAMETPKSDGSSFNIGTGQATDLNELATMILKVTGSSAKVIHAEPRAGDIKHSCCTAELARQHLGFVPKLDLEAGLRQVFEAQSATASR